MRRATGWASLTAALVMAGVLVLLASLLWGASFQRHASTRVSEHLIAHANAWSGLEHALAALRADPSYRQPITGELNGGTYTVSFAETSRWVKIESIGRYGSSVAQISQWVNTASNASNTNTPPPDVSNLSASTGMSSYGTYIILLTWDDPTDPNLEGIHIRWCWNLQCDSSNPDIAPGVQCYKIDNVETSTKYDITVYAKYRGGLISNGVSISVTLPPGSENVLPVDCM